MITITSKNEGFRRCGLAHGQAPTDYADDRFSDEELALLQAEPMLVIAVTADPEEGKGTTKGKAVKEKEKSPSDGDNN